MKTDYNKQAEQFLLKTKTGIKIKQAPKQTVPLWSKEGEQHGIKFQVMLQNAKSKYTFSFWDSIANKEQGKTPTGYDVLSCLNPLYEDNFKDFCSSFGYDTESRTAEKTYKAVVKQDTELKKLFSSKELEQLAEIQ